MHSELETRRSEPVFDTLPLQDSPVAPIAPSVEWMRFCVSCNSEQCFMADRICASGLVGHCSNCGDERIAPFTRTTSEAA